MSSKKTLLAMIIGFVLSNVLTTIWYMLTDEANMVPYRRSEINYGALSLNHLIYVGLMIPIFPAYYSANPGGQRGFFFGCIMALLMFLPQAMVVRAIWEVDFNQIFVLNTLAHTLIGGLIGLVFSFIHDYKNS